jgi:hypothetical protein
VITYGRGTGNLYLLASVKGTGSGRAEEEVFLRNCHCHFHPYPQLPIADLALHSGSLMEGIPIRPFGFVSRPFAGLLLLSYDFFFFEFCLPLNRTLWLGRSVTHNETPGLMLPHLPPHPHPNRLTDGRRQNVRSIFIFLGVGGRHRLSQLPHFPMGSGRYYVRLVRCCCPHDLLSGSEFLSAICDDPLAAFSLL